MDDLLLAAAANNAIWCDAVSRAHGCRTSTDAEAWASASRTPEHYPDAVTLVPTASAPAVLARIDAGPGCSVKDSFASLDLAPSGFVHLFDATWIVRRAGAHGSAAPRSWSAVTTPEHLRDWESAWAGGETVRRTFPVSMLATPGCTFVQSEPSSGRPAGAALCESDGVVGISNLFGPPDQIDRSWSEVIAFATEHFGDVALVGWEAGDDLDAPTALGFEPAGSLRVWLRP